MMHKIQYIAMQECKKKLLFFYKKMFTFLVQPSVDQADLEWSQKTQLTKKNVNGC